jgi:hypothetical protein
VIFSPLLEFTTFAQFFSILFVLDLLGHLIPSSRRDS